MGEKNNSYTFPHTYVPLEYYLVFFSLMSLQVMIIGRVAWTLGCCGYGRTALGQWCPKTRRGPRIRSTVPVGAFVWRPTSRPKCTRIRAPNVAIDTGTCANTKKTPRKRRWPEYTKRWKAMTDTRKRWFRRQCSESRLSHTYT